MRESDLERKIVQYAKRQGVLVYKFTSPSNRGVPDRIFISNGQVWFMEIKRQGQRPTKLQEHHLQKIQERGVEADWCDNLENAMAFIDRMLLL